MFCAADNYDVPVAPAPRAKLVLVPAVYSPGMVRLIFCVMLLSSA